MAITMAVMAVIMAVTAAAANRPQRLVAAAELAVIPGDDARGEDSQHELPPAAVAPLVAPVPVT
jgi:hypothetical protein